MEHFECICVKAIKHMCAPSTQRRQLKSFPVDSLVIGGSEEPFLFNAICRIGPCSSSWANLCWTACGSDGDQPRSLSFPHMTLDPVLATTKVVDHMHTTDRRKHRSIDSSLMEIQSSPLALQPRADVQVADVFAWWPTSVRP